MNALSWVPWKRGLVATAALMAAVFILFSGCNGGGGSGGEDENNGGTVTGGDYVVLAWNDLGMHCLNPTYDKLIILPPYNTLWAQVIQRGNPPRVVTSGVTVSYSIVNNTTSLNKLYYDGFWDPEVLDLFGINSLSPDKGLNLRDPTIQNGLSGTMQTVGDHFQADGIPVTPVDDDGVKDPYQVAQITVRDLSGTPLVETRAMVPTSDEINCGRCHSPGGTTGEVFTDILQAHDEAEGTDLEGDAPILCATCHGSPVLGSTDSGDAELYLSEAIHGFHADKTAPDGAITCYDCHPGERTQCNRSLAHTASDGNCVTCHGTMSQLAADIAKANDPKIPWVDEPKCISCHAGVAEVDTGTTLYRDASGHGGVYCAGCHQSPHAMVPSREDADNYQALQYQGGDVATIGSCAACHSSSKPEDGEVEEFREEHAGTNPERRSACAVCHTALPANISSSEFPHRFEWTRR